MYMPYTAVNGVYNVQFWRCLWLSFGPLFRPGRTGYNEAKRLPGTSQGGNSGVSAHSEKREEKRRIRPPV